MCLYPRLITNRKYISNKKNGGIIPAISDERTRIVPVGCGKCMECMKQKKRNWQVRLHEEIKERNKGYFVTLTFSNESIKELGELCGTLEGYERDNEIATKAMRRFLERWRKKYKKSVRHWMVTELGHNGTENIHMHGIIWTNEQKEEIEKIWKYGFVWIGDYVNEKTINYITKYITKTDALHKEYQPKVLTSSGIGKRYIGTDNNKRNKYNNEKTKEEYITNQGQKIALPIYYRNHTYTDEEKEKLWIEKLNKNERWVNGEKIDVSETEEIYYQALYYNREINKRLGYGDNEKDWERKRYENERRNINYMERIRKKGNSQN